MDPGRCQSDQLDDMTHQLQSPTLAKIILQSPVRLLSFAPAQDMCCGIQSCKKCPKGQGVATPCTKHLFPGRGTHSCQQSREPSTTQPDERTNLEANHVPCGIMRESCSNEGTDSEPHEEKAKEHRRAHGVWIGQPNLSQKLNSPQQ